MLVMGEYYRDQFVAAFCAVYLKDVTIIGILYSDEPGRIRLQQKDIVHAVHVRKKKRELT